MGLASAILYGFKNANGDVLGVIDADLQHPPEYMKEFIRAIEDGYDIAIGSRYVEGGRIEGWTWTRKMISKGAIMLAKLVKRNLNCKKIASLILRRYLDISGCCYVISSSSKWRRANEVLYTVTLL